MSLTAYPGNPQADGTALIVFAGPPNVTVEWSMTGPGSIEAQSECTDERGAAGAIFTPTAAGDVVTISVTHGAP